MTTEYSTEKVAELVAEAQAFSKAHHILGETLTADRYQRLAEALKAENKRAEQAEAELQDAFRTDIPSLKDERDELRAVITDLRSLEPTWHRGMYGSPDDMYSRISIHRILSRIPEHNNNN